MFKPLWALQLPSYRFPASMISNRYKNPSHSRTYFAPASRNCSAFPAELTHSDSDTEPPGLCDEVLIPRNPQSLGTDWTFENVGVNFETAPSDIARDRTRKDSVVRPRRARWFFLGVVGTPQGLTYVSC